MKPVPLHIGWDIPSIFDDDFWTYPAKKYTFPQINMEDTDKALIIHASVPGFSSKDIKVRVQGNNVIISGKKSEETEKKNKKYYYKEMSVSEFHRTISLPIEVNNSEVSAKIENGILMITLPKIIRPEDQEIEVEIK